MIFEKKSMTCVVQLVMLIVLSESSFAFKEDSIDTTEITESEKDNIGLYRLPKNAVPWRYDILIDPNMDDDNLTWTGQTRIHIEIVSPTAVLTLHAYKNLVIDDLFTELVNDNGSRFTPEENNRDDISAFMELKFNHEIPIGHYQLNLNYKGESIPNIIGFSKHNNKYNSKTVLTLLEPDGARRVFPCWDEPALKAYFKVSIRYFPNYTALSNMPEVANVETSDGKILTTFDRTPIMSTYLLNFVVTNSKSVFNDYRNISIHGTDILLDNGKKLLDITLKTIAIMESYTGLPIGVPKIGSIIFPSDVGGALEQWGLISYGSGILQYNTELLSFHANSTVAHEVVHSWFGNRVTARWWNDIWLSESFTHYFALTIIDKISDNLGPSFFVLSNNIPTTIMEVMKDLAVRTPNTDENLIGLFNYHRYFKGAAIIHMFRNVLGDDVFQSGIQEYLAKYSFKAVTTNDLIAEFQTAYNADISGKESLNLKKIMTPWLTQEGHPIVIVRRNYTTGDIEVSQISSTGNRLNRWWIPLTYATKSNPNFTSTVPVTWISDKEDHVKIVGIDKDDWIILNVQASGFYKVIYDDENWLRIANYLHTENYTSIHVLNRVQIIFDALYFVYFEPDYYCTKLHNIITYLSQEIESPPWLTVVALLQGLGTVIYPSEECNKVQSSIDTLLDSFIEKVGLDINSTDDALRKFLKNRLASWNITSRDRKISVSHETETSAMV